MTAGRQGGGPPSCWVATCWRKGSGKEANVGVAALLQYGYMNILLFGDAQTWEVFWGFENFPFVGPAENFC